jgi:hypothetical protein
MISKLDLGPSKCVEREMSEDPRSFAVNPAQKELDLF